MGMWTNTHCFDFQIFWAGGTTGMTYFYYIIYIILFIQDHIYIYNILYTGLHILWCEHVSSSARAPRVIVRGNRRETSLIYCMTFVTIFI